MEDNYTFTFRAIYLECLKGLPLENQRLYLYGLCYYGVYKEILPELSNDVNFMMMLNCHKSMIDGSQNWKAKKIEEGKTGGRPTTNGSDDELIEAIIKLGKIYRRTPTEVELKEELGLPQNKSLRNRTPWREREAIVRKALAEETKSEVPAFNFY